MSRLERIAGFTMVEGVFVVLAIGLIGVTSAAVVRQNHKSKAVPSAAQQAVTSQAPTVPTIKDTTDLTQAQQTLDQTNVDASATDSTQLDSQLSDF